ncbi:hypothetical protein L1049_002178 [Liquidambar formosana]|uniref:Ubiquitin fusion degradation protein UFD1 N-terminal subdomain 2 domain-containing protein n=1 Tax=Liquidambar formosana TaxID=63359 RepID=A0AAP0R8Q0_LIQFO
MESSSSHCEKELSPLVPYTTDFIRLSNPKAVSEVTLRNFSCLIVGDTMMITHNGKNFYIDVIKTKPSSAVSIIETDCVVDFAPPLDYKESKKPKPQRIVEEPTKEEPKFKSFTGAKRRLDGKPVTELAASVLKEDQSIVANSTSSVEKICDGAVKESKQTFKRGFQYEKFEEGFT